jgi:DNA modification methylase
MDYKKDLAEKLPQLKKIEGFPIGKDEDILALSRPPFYTACPNPYIKEFIDINGKKYDESSDTYHREPYLGDISESKEDTLYNLHTYHTKVPPKAIMKKILHYTQPNEIVLDGFSGTGMTGVAAYLCSLPHLVKEVTKNTHLENISTTGLRKVILNELSPIAAFISKNYSQGCDNLKFKKEALRILYEVNEECGWMFECDHKGYLGRIEYTVYSDVFLCPICGSDVVFWEVGVDHEEERNKSEFFCNSCNAVLSNQNLKRKFRKIIDNEEEYQIAELKPVLMAYLFNGKKYKKNIDEKDLALLEKIEKIKIPYWYPKDLLPNGFNTKQPISSHGLSRVDFFYSKRNLYATSAIYDKILKSDPDIKHTLLFWLMSVMLGQTKMNRYFEASYSQVNRYLKGTLYVGKKISEVNFLYSLKGKVDKISKYLNYQNEENVIVTNGTATNLPIPENSIDYIFTDPPFGGNIMYSELNFIWESWLKIFTNTKNEAIINSYQSKALPEYANLMDKSFQEYYRVLKPKRWITVEFHNSRSDVWNCIQSGLTKAGFVISSVSILDKKQETFKQMTSAGAVKSDLTISAFKPSESFEHKFLSQAGLNLENEFINEFLSMQPIMSVIERTEKMLYSKMLSYYIQRGYEIQYDARTFYQLLGQNFISEDGFWFTPNQINSYVEYKKKLKLEKIDDIKSGSFLLFIEDEKSALVWLFNYLEAPRSFQEIHLTYTQLANVSGDNVPELKEMLDQNFIYENERYRRPKSAPEYNQITEKREKVLQREFESLLIKVQSEKGKIKLVRKEALFFGFEMCYKTKRFNDILSIAKKLDKTIYGTPQK